MRGAAVIVLVAGFAVSCGSKAPLAGSAAADAGPDAGPDALADSVVDVAGEASGADDSGPGCGGDLLGAWVTTEDGIAPNAPSASVNACHNLSLDRNADGTYAASTWYPRGPSRDLGIWFRDTQFVTVEIRRGPVPIHYAASCLASNAGTPTCAELADAIKGYGLATGDFQGATCAAAQPDGCDCTIALFSVGGESGTWSGGAGTATLMGSITQTQGTTSYCIAAGALRFGAGIDAIMSGASKLTFLPVDCADGKRGLFEASVDCGMACPLTCN
jgi:hypothetical protein